MTQIGTRVQEALQPCSDQVTITTANQIQLSDDHKVMACVFVYCLLMAFKRKKHVFPQIKGIILV